MDEFFTALERLLDLTNRYGFAVVICGIVVAAAVIYGPRLFRGHIEFMSSAAEVNKSNAVAQQGLLTRLETTEQSLVSIATEQKDSREIASRCGEHFCDALEHVADKLEIRERVEDSLGAIRRELRKQG